MRACVRIRPAVIAVLSLWSQAAFAQPPPAGRPPAPAPAPQQGTPPAIEVNDPLLATPAAPKKTLASWREALNLIAARSVDLQLALQEVEKAAGLSRQAL